MASPTISIGDAEICRSGTEFFANDVSFEPSRPYLFSLLSSTDDSDSSAFAVDEYGTVAGYAYRDAVNFDAALWNSGVLTLLKSLGGSAGTAYALNGARQAAGFSYTSGNASGLGTMWTGKATIDFRVTGYANSTVFAMNLIGTAVGEVYDDYEVPYPLIWYGSVGKLLPTLGGRSGAAFGLNAGGKAVGYTDLPGNTAHHGVLWSMGVPIDLGVPLGGNNSVANAINDAGIIVGSSELPRNGGSRAVVWVQPKKASSLSGLGGASSSAYSINNSNQIVGRASDQNGESHAVLWEAGSTITNLNNNVDASTSLSGWKMNIARQINQHGWIVGEATRRVADNVQTRGFLLRPSASVSAKASTTSGASLVTSVRLTAAAPFKGIRVAGPVCGGVAPYQASFELLDAIGLRSYEIAKIEADLDGDGTTDYASTDAFTPIGYTYSSPGLYTVHFIATTVAGEKLHEYRLVAIGGVANAQQPLVDVIAAFSRDMATQRIEHGLTYLTLPHRRTMAPLLRRDPSLVRRLAALASLNFKPILLEDKFAELGSFTQGTDGSRTFVRVVFIRQANDEWKIDSF